MYLSCNKYKAIQLIKSYLIQLILHKNGYSQIISQRQQFAALVRQIVD